mgnify:CR=1 FL=1
MDGPFIYILDGGLGARISKDYHSVVKKPLRSIEKKQVQSYHSLKIDNIRDHYQHKLKTPISDQNFISKMWQMWKWKFYVVRSERGHFGFVDIIHGGL